MPVATETEHSNNQLNNPQVLTGLAMIGGLGLTVMIVAFGYGVVDSSADSGLIGMALVAGGLLVLGASVAWFFVVEPHKHFDDINKPMYHGHHDHNEHDAHDAPEQEVLDQNNLDAPH